MKYAFYFTLKGLFVLKILKFLSWISGQVEKTAWEINNCNTHTIQYLKKCNQVMKFGQFRRYNMRNIFLEKSHKTWRRNFCQTLKNQNWAYPRINNLKFYTVCFCCKPSWGRSLYIETKLETTCFDLIKRDLEAKRDLKLVYFPHFRHDFWKKIFLLSYSID